MTSNPSKWWLISDEDVRMIGEFVREIADHHASPAKRNSANKVLHTLYTGLNATDAIPADWAQAEDVAD